MYENHSLFGEISRFESKIVDLCKLCRSDGVGGTMDGTWSYTFAFIHESDLRMCAHLKASTRHFPARATPLKY